jgi:hypothetical protein
MFMDLHGYPTAVYGGMIQAAGYEKGSMVPVMGGSLIAGARRGLRSRTG